MIQKLDKYGSTSVDNANVVILDKNGNVKKIAAASGTVTSILTASPITGGPITSSGTMPSIARRWIYLPKFLWFLNSGGRENKNSASLWSKNGTLLSSELAI